MRFLISIFSVSVLLFVSCGGNDFETDISKTELNKVQFKSLYQDLMDADTNNLKAYFEKMNSKYGSFYKKFLISVFGDAMPSDTVFQSQFNKFVGEKEFRSDLRLIQSIFSSSEIEKLEIEATDAFKRAKKLFPDTSLPNQFIFMYSALNFRNVNVDSTLAVGLEFYLGKDAPLYNMTQSPIPIYKRQLMDKEYLIRDMMMAWVLYKFDQNEPEKNLLESMIEAGKFFYCTKRLLPTIEDSILFGYNSKQIDYCIEFEKDLWKFFSEKNRLYLNDMKEIMAYNSEGPFTAAISKDCPPAIARYMGYRIVCEYMKKNEVALPQLMIDTDFQKIMMRSKYRP